MQIGEMNGQAIVVGTDRETGLVTPIYRTWPERFAWGYIREMEHFVDCIRTRRRAGGERNRRPLGGRLRARRHEVVPGGAAGAALRSHELMRAAVYHGPGRPSGRGSGTAGDRRRTRRCSGCTPAASAAPIIASSPASHRLFPPGVDRVPGHEIVGEIVEVGADVAARCRQDWSSSRRTSAAATAASACPATTIAAPISGARHHRGWRLRRVCPRSPLPRSRRATSFRSAPDIDPLSRDADRAARLRASRTGSARHRAGRHGARRRRRADRHPSRDAGAPEGRRADHRSPTAGRSGSRWRSGWAPTSPSTLGEEDVSAVVARRDRRPRRRRGHRRRALARGDVGRARPCSARGRIAWFAGLPKDRSTLAIDANTRPLPGASRHRHDGLLDVRLPARGRVR